MTKEEWLKIIMKIQEDEEESPSFDQYELLIERSSAIKNRITHNILNWSGKTNLEIEKYATANIIVAESSDIILNKFHLKVKNLGSDKFNIILYENKSNLLNKITYNDYRFTQYFDNKYSYFRTLNKEEYIELLKYVNKIDKLKMFI